MASPKGPVRPAQTAPADDARQCYGGKPPDPPSLERLSRARAVAAEHAGRRKPPSPPPDPGELLADIPRGDGTRFRIAWCEVEGRPFVRLAVWGADGWPVKGKQVSVRLAELGLSLEAFIAACEKASGWRP